MYTHNLDPVLVDFGFMVIRWYSLAYIFGIILGWWFGKKIINHIIKFTHLKFNIKEFDDLITYLIISIIVGGRLGYIIFYNLGYYLANPLDILKVWEGGMSFHGALLGIIFGTYLFSKKKNVPTFFLLDIIACVSPIGIFLGRLANFINGELVGKVTSVSWGVIFPVIDSLPRHPSQLYEAVLEGAVLFLILNRLIFKQRYKMGTCSYLFLIYYGTFRILSEFFRQPDPQIGYLFNLFSMGTLLSFLMVISGLIILYVFREKNES
ncbi:prolipoprotein diacylglyceryl transferase [Candidatus Pelagibacter bacterium]|nr:prolipoprotein diacylglyceryl transferase [Candidatus Pelagibacter bacterium]MDA9618968.1 prolipoprotein diacylglyceryl transferase [Candidatus Pelagibacter bacterium]